MKNFTKLTLILSMLFGILGGVSSVKAGKLYADLSKLSNGPASTWNSETNTMTWTGTSNNMIANFDFAAGDYSTYDKIGVGVTSLNNASYVRVQIRANGKEKTVFFEGTGTIEKSLQNDFEFTAADLESVEWIRLLGSSYVEESHTINESTPASAVISEVYLNQPEKIKDVDFLKMAASSGSGYATWTWDSEKSEGLFSWTGTWSNSIALPGLTGNLSGYTTVNYNTVAGTADHFRILIYYSNGAAQTTYAATVGTKSVSFAEMGVDPVNLAFISSINFSGASDATGNVTLKSFSLSGPELNYINAITTYAAPAGTTDINGMTGAGDIKWTVTYPQELAPQTGWCGNIDGDDKSVDISLCDYLHFVVTNVEEGKKLSLRVFVSDGSTRTCLYPNPIENASNVDDWTAVCYITTPGTYVVKITDYPLLRGFKAGNGWGGDESNGKIIVSQAYVSSGEPVNYVNDKYTLYGELPGSSVLTAALADASITYYDATGICGTGVDLTSVANHNALFKANAGALSNTKNVIVGTTCANLILEDNYTFKAPFDFTATAASYTTTINATAGAGTLCLPFAATIPDGVTAWKLTYIGGDAATANEVTTTIPANTPVLLNGSGEKTFSGSSVAIDADAANTEGDMIGVFAVSRVPTDSYVLQYQDGEENGLGFYQVTEGDPITIKPFRAYLTASGGARSLRIVYLDDETTGISATLNDNGKMRNDRVVYNLNGQRVEQATKGLYIKNGKKVVIK